MAAPPLVIRVDGIEVAQWPEKPVKTRDLEDTALGCLLTGYATYVERAPFLRFDESSIDRLRRVAKVVVEGIPHLSAEVLVDRYLKLNGRPV